MSKSDTDKVDPKVEDVLILLAAGTFLAASLVSPGLPMVAREVLKLKKEMDYSKKLKEWEKFNLWRLRQIIKRMQNSKYVEIKEQNGVPLVKITQKGRNKLLKYDIDKMRLDERKLDGYWRLIIYDVKTAKRQNSETFRRAISKLNLLKLQKSVYLTPFRCEDEIEYLRQVFDIGNEVLILRVKNIENEQPYRRYFGV